MEELYIAAQHWYLPIIASQVLEDLEKVINVALSRDFVYPQNIEFKIEDCYFKDSGGGVIFYTGSQELIITNSVFTNNAPIANPPYQAGAIHSSGTLILTNVSFFGYMTRQYGGAIHSTAPIIATQTTFYNNKANQLGGAIYSTSPITVARCDLTDNMASQQGGAIYNTCD